MLLYFVIGIGNTTSEKTLILGVVLAIISLAIFSSSILYVREKSKLLGAFTLAGISGMQIPVFGSRSKSRDFYKCGHKNLTNYRAQHRAANRTSSCDFLELARLFASRRMCERWSK